MFAYSDTNKRYHTFDYHCRRTFGHKMVKLTLDAGFYCPNREGGRSGCTFCSGRGSGDFCGDALLTITEQLQLQKERLSAKWPEAGYLAYFQAFTNTYAPLPILRKRYEEALAFPGIQGINIATRADCITGEALEYLEELNRRTYVMVELGLQTIHDKTARRINRGHTYADFLQGYTRLKQIGIPVCVHLIDGLPGETEEMMLQTARETAGLRPDAVKIHLLHVLRGTPLEQEYQQGQFSLLSRKEYVAVVCSQLELLPAETVIHRLTGDGDRSQLVGPLWSRDKRRVLNEIDKELALRDTWQGMGFE